MAISDGQPGAKMSDVMSTAEYKPLTISTSTPSKEDQIARGSTVESLRTVEHDPGTELHAGQNSYPATTTAGGIEVIGTPPRLSNINKSVQSQQVLDTTGLSGDAQRSDLREGSPSSTVGKGGRRPSVSARSSYASTPPSHRASASASHPTTPERPGSLAKDEAGSLTFRSPPSFESNRPTSIPSLQAASASRRRDVLCYPQYPDQSFAALQAHPPSIPTLRSRASNLIRRGSPSATSSNSNSVTDLPHVHSGAKTVGNTPAQSPGLFSPSLPSRTPRSDSEDGHYTTPKLHPTHVGAPKETTKLAKDFNPVTNRKQFNNYEIVKQLGSGQHGKVKLGVNLENGEHVAIKIVRRFSKKLRLGKTGNPDDAIKKEVAILKKARHPHVVSLYEVIDDDEFEKVYLVLEFVEKGEIVWQKPTEKSIGMFEKERLERERSGNYDEAFERAAIEEYNSRVPAQREEKAAKIREQLEARQLEEQNPVDSRSSERRPSLADPYWSLEYGGDSENEYGAETSPEHSYFGADTRMSRADIHAAENAQLSPESGPPSHTPRSHPYPSNVDQVSTSQPASRPDTPYMPQGSIYGGYSDRGSSVPDLDFNLTQILANEAEWSQDEDNYQFRKVPCLTLNQALDAFRDTVLGLEYLHYQGIMHRDIKPANLLWTSNYRVKISDFGVSYLRKPLREDGDHAELPEADVGNLDEDIELAKTVGTPAFYAPELCDPDLFDADKQSVKPAITNLIDVWALGVTLYGMIYGRLPFFDENHYKMFQKIARDELFIPKYRLKGVSHTDKTPSNHNKRMDDVLEYEEVDDTLQDLLKRLLAKKPSERISLKEVKHHPWVISGIEDRDEWLDQTDPGVQSQGKKIEPSHEEVQDAVVGLTLLDRLKTEVKRMTSVLRGSREPRKRTDSNPKPPGSANSTSASKSKDGSAASPVAGDERRNSLRGDEQIYSALRASREPSDHPLAQSVAASPEMHHVVQYFPGGESSSSLLGQRREGADSADRSTAADRALSTADSVQTIRPPPPRDLEMKREALSAPHTSSGNVGFSDTTSIAGPSNVSAASNVSSLFGAPGRFMSNIRGHERGASTQSSRSSSIGTSGNREELHAAPSLAMSSAIAAGHVDQPPVLREDLQAPATEQAPTQPHATLAEMPVDQGQHRQDLEPRRTVGHRRSISQQASSVVSPTSPDEFLFYAQQRPASVADSSLGFPAMSSSSDMIVSGESAAHSRIPSVVSGASSLSAAPEEESGARLTLEKSESPLTMAPPGQRRRSMYAPTTTPATKSMPAQATANVEDEAGYNGEPEEEDSSSEDEGIVMG